MITRRTILGSMISLAAAFIGRSSGQTQRYYRTGRQARPNPAPPMVPDQRLGQRETDRQQLRDQIRKEGEKQRDESIRQAIGATDQQWAAIEPKFNRVRTLMRQARMALAPMSYSSGGTSASERRSGGGGTGGAGGGAAWGVGAPPKDTDGRETRNWSEHGWKWLRPSAQKSPSEMTEAEKAAEGLLDLLEDKAATSETIKQKMNALRLSREDARKQLPGAQRELREVLTLRQEAALTLMGYLD